MSSDKALLFTPVKLGKIMLPNRFIRSATYEGLADRSGRPLMSLADVYSRLAANGVGTIITGFCYVSQQGRAMHPAQAGMHCDDLIDPWHSIVEHVKRVCPETKLIMQLAHAGRQTLRRVTGQDVVGPGARKCSYFKQKVKPLTASQIEAIVADFASAARRAQHAGFDGVQVHAAHGYLIHQFLSPATNRRQDQWRPRNRFLCDILRAIRTTCGPDFPILLKLSHADDKALTDSHAVETIQAAAAYVDAVEISYGTMERPLNIFRGACPIDLILSVNPQFNRMPAVAKALWKWLFLGRHLEKIIPFKENYNLDAAVEIQRAVDVPVFAVGGIRSLASMINIVAVYGLPAVSLCRPFIAEPDLVRQIQNGSWRKSSCVNCNYCAIYCDTHQSLQCHQVGGGNHVQETL